MKSILGEVKKLVSVGTDGGPEKYDKAVEEYCAEVKEFLEKQDAYVLLTSKKLDADDVQSLCLLRGEGTFLYAMLVGLVEQLEPWLQQELALVLMEKLALDEALVRMTPEGEA